MSDAARDQEDIGMDSDGPRLRPTMTQVAAAALVHLSFEGPPPASTETANHSSAFPLSWSDLPSAVGSHSESCPHLASEKLFENPQSHLCANPDLVIDWLDKSDTYRFSSADWLLQGTLDCLLLMGKETWGSTA